MIENCFNNENNNEDVTTWDRGIWILHHDQFIKTNAFIGSNPYKCQPLLGAEEHKHWLNFYLAGSRVSIIQTLNSLTLSNTVLTSPSSLCSWPFTPLYYNKIACHLWHHSFHHAQGRHCELKHQQHSIQWPWNHCYARTKPLSCFTLYLQTSILNIKKFWVRMEI